MVRIVGGGKGKSVGRPGYPQLKRTGLMTRAKTGVTGKITQNSVTRLFKRNPANRTAIIGTSKDVLGDTNQRFNRISNPTARIFKRRKGVAQGTGDSGNNTRVKRGKTTNYSNRDLKKY